MHTRGSNLICIRSRDLTNTNTVGSSGRLVLQEAIQARDDETLFCCVFSATFPNSWYNLSSYLDNNTLSFKETGDSEYIELTLDEGSYNINELMEEIKEKLEANSSNTLTYTLTYTEITNAVTITSSNTAAVTTNFDFTTSTTCRRMIGFLSSIKTIDSSNTSITSDRTVDVTDTYNSIYIRLPSFSNQKVIESNSGRYSNIAAHIPVPLSRNTIFTYEPALPFCMELNQKTISTIDISITFQDESKRVHFAKGDWEINLLIEYRRRSLPKPISHVLHGDIIKS